MSKSRNRGFEFISKEQWHKDIGENFSYIDCDGTYNALKKPRRATNHSAGYDIFSPFGFSLEPNESIKLPIGVKAYMQNDEVLKIYPRSSLGFRYFARLANTIGIGDSDYYNNQGNEGHYWVKIRNEGDTVLNIAKGDAIAQAIFEKYLIVDGDSYNNGSKRVGGIGSTTK